MKYRLIPTTQYEEAIRLGRFRRGHTCFGLTGQPRDLHKVAKRDGLTRSFYSVVPVPQPVVMSDPDPRFN